MVGTKRSRARKPGSLFERPGADERDQEHGESFDALRNVVVSILTTGQEMMSSSEAS